MFTCACFCATYLSATTTLYNTFCQSITSTPPSYAAITGRFLLAAALVAAELRRSLHLSWLLMRCIRYGPTKLVLPSVCFPSHGHEGSRQAQPKKASLLGSFLARPGCLGASLAASCSSPLARSPNGNLQRPNRGRQESADLETWLRTGAR